MFLLLLLDPFREKQLSYLRTVKTEQRGGAQDLSLSEIAAELGVSRQGVHELLSRAEESLGEFERVTGCIARDRRTAIALADIKAACERLQSIPDAKEAQQEILRASASIKE